MSNDEEKKPLKMYPGVSLGSSPKRGMSKFKIFLLILIVVAGASAGGYWINREFINAEINEPEIIDIVEADPKPVVVPEDNTKDEDLNLTVTETETATDSNIETKEQVSEDIDRSPTASEATNSDDDLGLEAILDDNAEEEKTTDNQIGTPEISKTTDDKAEPSIIDETITAVSDTVDAVSTSVKETVTDLTSTPTNKNEVLAQIKESDLLLSKKEYTGAINVLSGMTNLPVETLGKLAPDVYYRAGLANRYAKNENEAQKNWLKAYQDFPSTISGRLSALALADTWYYWYVDSKQDLSKWESIRDAYSTAIGMDGARFLPQVTEAKIAEKLNYLNDKLVFDPKMPVSGAIFHKVEPGEYISTIAKNYGLGTWSSIVDINKVDPKNLKVGMTLKIMQGRLSILVDKKNFTLSWYLDGKFIKRYKCATGAVETETPVGHYEIFKMDAEPNWTDPKTGKVYKYGEEGHLIGSRWLAIRGGSKTGLGIHGTVYPDSIGTKASNGCIRLLNKNVEELYGFASIANNNESEVIVIE